MKKLINKKGFTLMEMLIVVAIIVILVAISIPTFSSQLDNAKAATDAANLRAAKGIAQTVEMTGSWDQYGVDETSDTPVTLYYDIESGKFVGAASKPANYGQSTDCSGKVIAVVIKKGVMQEEPYWDPKPTPPSQG